MVGIESATHGEASMINMDEYESRLMREFVDLATDALARAARDSSLRDIAMIVQQLKGQGAAFEYPNVTLVAHRAEDLLATAGNGVDLSKLQSYLDRIDEILLGELPKQGDVDKVLERLPPLGGFSVDDVEIPDLEAVLVALPGTQARLVRRELAACGYPSVLIGNTFEALNYIHRVQPDFVLASAVMPGLTGIELLVALKAIKATRHIPCALFTSLDEASRDLQDLPSGIPIVRKGASFSNDLADALSTLKPG
jgi:CheY-like chemotaxis protein